MAKVEHDKALRGDDGTLKRQGILEQKYAKAEKNRRRKLTSMLPQSLRARVRELSNAGFESTEILEDSAALLLALRDRRIAAYEVDFVSESTQRDRARELRRLAGEATGDEKSRLESEASMLEAVRADHDRATQTILAITDQLRKLQDSLATTHRTTAHKVVEVHVIQSKKEAHEAVGFERITSPYDSLLTEE